MLGTPIQIFQIWLYTFLLVLATTAIVARLLVRRFTRTKLQMNDWLMLLAYVNVLGLGIAVNIAVVHGEMGAHYSELSSERKKEVIALSIKMIAIIIPLLLSTSSILVKMSITHFYIVIFPHMLLTKLCKVQLAVLTAGLIFGSVPFFFLCRPLAFAWDKTLDGKCTDIRVFWLAISGVALFFDLTVVVLPIPVVWGLKCSVRKKIQLTALFGMGLFIFFITVGRIIEMYRAEYLQDITYSSAKSVMCSVPEPVLSLVIGCIPITVPLFRRAKTKKHSGLPVTPSAPPSYESRIELSAIRKAARQLSGESQQKRLEEHLYPMGTFNDISSGCGSIAESPSRLLRKDRDRSVDNSVSGRRTRRSRDYFGTESSMGDGITVLTEVHIDSEKRAECASIV